PCRKRPTKGAAGATRLRPNRLPRASVHDPNVLRLGALLALRDVKLNLLPLLQIAVASARDCADVDEHVRTALDTDEAEAPVAVEPLHRALRHVDLLRSGANTTTPGGPPIATPLASLSPDACRSEPGGRPSVPQDVHQGLRDLVRIRTALCAQP